VRVWCERGKSIDIPLRADGRTNTTIQYAISSEPKYGSLGGISTQTYNASTVTYTHSTATGERDTFTYVARTSDSAYSQPATVEVLLSEPPVQPSVPETVDFGKAGVGGKSIHKITITNQNGGAGNVQVASTKPWKPLSPAAWLPANGETAIEVAFEPTALGEVRGVLHISLKDQVVATAALRGEGAEAFDVERVADAVDAWTISNYSDTILSLTLTAPEGLNFPDTLLLPAHSSVPFVVRRLAGWNGAITGDIVISGSGLTRTIPVDMSAIPARIFVSPTEVDFGIITQGEEATAEITVSNTGGNPAFLSATLSSGMRIVPVLGAAPIAAGEKQIMKIFLRGGEKSKGRVTLTERDGATAVFGWEVTILPTAPPQTDVSLNPSAITSPDDATPDTPVDIRASAISHDRIRLTWQEPPARPASYRVEYCLVERPDEGDSIEEHWTIWRNLEISRTDDHVTAELSHLFPLTTYSLRVMSLDASGHASAPSPTLTATTLARPAWSLPRAVSRFFFATVLVCGLGVALIVFRTARRVACRGA